MNIPGQIVAVAGLVENSQDEILLVRHPHRGWEIPGGQVEEGENLVIVGQQSLKDSAKVNVINNL